MSSSKDSSTKYPFYGIKSKYKAPLYDAPQDRVMLEPDKHLSFLHSQQEVSLPTLTLFSWIFRFFWWNCIPICFFWIPLGLLNDIPWFGKDWTHKFFSFESLKNSTRQVFDKMLEWNKDVQSLPNQCISTSKHSSE